MFKPTVSFLFLDSFKHVLDVIQNEVEEPIPKKHKQPEASTEAAEQMDES